MDLDKFSFVTLFKLVMKEKEVYLKSAFGELLPGGSHKLLNYFITRGQIRIYKAGDQILETGQPSDHFFWLIEGGVKSRRNGELLLHKKGDFLGLAAVLQKIPILYDYYCISDVSVLLELPSDGLFELLGDEPQAIFPIMQILFKKAELTENNGVQIMQADSEEKLLRALQYVAKKYGLSDENTLKVELSGDDLAMLCGTSRTSTYRWLKLIEEKGIIKRQGSKIQLLSLNLLGKSG
ncbi:Crp/Fnr family transcriptional regulator [Schleiferia thermophila]|jgi:CRP-like cAMP-binding protein|uniref:CRP-like cAMP-binding protein n=1 Tax=Schleiferia thermophila TaxID=884107 RepID=A0A369ABC1_9FLAO|nr:Crp/Fnr family transcriptional regulator [Schleiferia thermophila]PMB36678.1 hypothetical protein CEN47_08330 [Fischerella thermalis CCMEE 5319]RCX05377.1 CRP-like cAMP-binding protein [Schleiferia thermophila]GCD79116.1 hypothetical protein JCM30197_03630 [Schleiferia thermophila]